MVVDYSTNTSASITFVSSPVDIIVCKREEIGSVHCVD